MITVSNVSVNFSGTELFKNVDLKFTPGNCYGIIGANGAGKSTFLRLLSGDLEPTSGEISIPKDMRMSVLKQDHNAFDEHSVLDTIIMGNMTLYNCGKEKDAIYEKADFSDEDGIRAAELEALFAELNGWESESDASRMIQGLGLSESILYSEMSSLSPKEKVKVLLAQALFGNPDIILLDEPTNGLDIAATNWLEDFILDYLGTVIVVSHDRHFLNVVCTNTVDIDYGQIRMFVGNYEFWYESSQLMEALIKNQKKKNEEKVKELQSFISRFSANKSKSKQATSRRKLIDKLTIEELPVSNRRYPFVGFNMDREAGKEILAVNSITKEVDGVNVLCEVSFRLAKGDKVAIISENGLAPTLLFKILAGELEPDEGDYKWGVSTSQSYLPQDNNSFFNENNMTIIDWLRQYSEDKYDAFLRGFLGRMLFSGDDVYKPVNVLSGGERVRCMLSRMMLFGANVIMLDQPTDHLDLESITAVNNGLIDFKGNIIFASHDHEFIQTVANRIIEITDRGVIDRQCTFDEYLEWKAAQK